MEWFSLWLPLVLQLVVPGVLLAWLALGRHAMKARGIAVATLVATYVLAIGIAGLWLVLPWWLPFGYGAAIVWIIARRLRSGDRQPARAQAASGLVTTVSIGALAVVLQGIIGLALAERGDVLGLVGNSGNTGEPHLHVHAQRPGSAIARLSGEPVPIRLGGRYLVRNDRIRAGAQKAMISVPGARHAGWDPIPALHHVPRAHEAGAGAGTDATLRAPFTWMTTAQRSCSGIGTCRRSRRTS